MTNIKLNDVFSVEWAKDVLKNPDTVIAVSDVALAVLFDNNIPQEEIDELFSIGIFKGMEGWTESELQEINARTPINVANN